MCLCDHVVSSPDENNNIWDSTNGTCTIGNFAIRTLNGNVPLASVALIVPLVKNTDQ